MFHIHQARYEHIHNNNFVHDAKCKAFVSREDKEMF